MGWWPTGWSRSSPCPHPSRPSCGVHDERYLTEIEAFCAAGGGRVDTDTVAVTASWEAARLAAGAGLGAVERLEDGQGDAAFCAVRPPGHHATPLRGMGFCLVNHIAVTAATLADRGDRVLIVDYDAHHGNGTQDAFWDDPRVTFVSLHQHPLYPGTGAAHERGGPDALGSTVNVPLPPGATGDVYRTAVDEIVAPLVDSLAPDWLLVSAGFDAHRADPLTDLGLTAGDFADVTRELVALAPPGRTVLFLEGGYDLDAVTASTVAALGALLGETVHAEAPTAGGPGVEVVRQLAAGATS